jgi:hypothetical protein
MKNLLKTSLLGVAALAPANVASAQVNIICSGPTNVSSTVNGPLQAFVVSLDVVDAGKNITGINITLSDVDGRPSVHQVQSFNDPGTAPSPFQDSPALNSDARRNADTHLLFNDAALLAAGTDAAEPGDAAAAAGNDGTRIHRFVGANALTSGNQGIVAASQTDPLPLIYVVLKPSESAILSGQVALSGETSPRQIGPYVVCFIPEPTSLSFLALGGLALARRRCA